MDKSYLRTKCACYMGNITGAVAGNLPPVLFLTFRGLYGISYTLLGLLVLINFVTQLSVDLVFSFFSHKFNIVKTVKFTPVLAVIGLIVYSLAPVLFPSAVYAGLVLGTVIFSASSGLSEVLLSPVIAAIPSENPEHEMSKLHSVYAWGVVGVIMISTVYLLLLKGESWRWLALGFAVIPLISVILYTGAKIPEMETPEKVSGALAMMRKKELWLCVIAIFLGGASECTMAQWSSSYLEQALGIEKVWGDIFGVAAFALMLGLGRTLYAKFGKNIEKILFLSTIGAVGCYLTAVVSNIAVIGLIACGLTGFCTAMLWPGSLIVASERIPAGGVFVYAMMAAGGDLGASVAPQLVGVVTDAVAGSSAMADVALRWGITAEQLGMKLGMAVGTAFPILAVFVFLHIWRTKKKNALPLRENA